MKNIETTNENDDYFDFEENAKKVEEIFQKSIE